MQNLNARVALALAALTLGACGDRGESATGLQLSDPGDIAVFLLQTQETFPEGNPKEFIAALKPGECTVEWYRAPGEYSRGSALLLERGEAASATAWAGFTYGYRTYGGKLIYRATCLVPATAAGRLMMMEEMHVPRLMGDELPVVPQGSWPEQSTNFTISADELDCGMEGQEPCQDDEIIVEGEDPCEDPDTYYEESTGSCQCYTDSCGTDGDGSGGTDDGSTTDGGGSTGDTSSPDGGSLETDSDGLLPPEPPDCELEDLDERARTWCDASPPDASQWNTLNTAYSAVESRCADLADEWTRAKDNLRVWTHTTEKFGGAAPIGGDWLLLSTWYVDEYPEVGLAHELLHLAGYEHPEGTPERDHFIEREKTCSGGLSAFELGSTSSD